MMLFRHIAVGLVVVAALVLSAGWAAANSTRGMAYVIRAVLARTVKAVEVKDLRFGSLTYSFPSSWSFKEVRLQLSTGNKVATFFAPQVEITDVLDVLTSERAGQLVVSRADVFYDKFKANAVSGRMTLTRQHGGLRYKGDLSAAAAAWDKIAAAAIEAAFEGDTRELTCGYVTADAYNGKISGMMRLTFTAPAGYLVDANFQEMDSALLERSLGGAFRELGGRLSGHMRVSGTGERIEDLEASSKMPGGGAVSAALLSTIASYLPSSAQKKRLDALISSGGKLAVEVFSFTIRNDGPDHLSGEIGLKSREANLELNVSHEISVDARIDSLLRAWSAVFKQERI
ncbi:MAG: hypothetical protein HQL22_07225 [Candidatus Omnitrophica bacterium]|nr:hypothetical protein [Candidatus Omnitrophota bacterium]